jgi:hypothetical protein
MLLVAGCATAAGGVPGELGRAAEAAASATASGALAVELLDTGSATSSVTDTALSDALRETQSAEVAAATLTVRTAAEDAARRRTLGMLQRAATALADARMWAGRVPTDVPSPSTALTEIADDLDDLAAELGSGR